jgi:CubicO group peptidase (beta-lactamase class C family)
MTPLDRLAQSLLFILATMIVAFLASSRASAEPDEAALGQAQGYPIGNSTTMFAERLKVGSFSAMEKILPSRVVAHGSDALALEQGREQSVTYVYGNRRFTFDDYLEHQRVTGLLVLKDNRIVAERYRYGRNERHRFISFSMAKSVTSLLVGIAVEKKLIESLDDSAEKYVVELKGSNYGRATLRQLLRMSSGVKFTEVYDGRDDIFRLRRAQIGMSREKPLEVLTSFREQAFSPGEKFAYASSESTVLGYVLLRATKTDLATLTSQWLWQPMGAEADAIWTVGADGQEQAEGGFNATLRDYGRLGLLLAHDGARGEQQIVPKDYLLAATDGARQPLAFRPLAATSYFGYGYQFWLYPLRERTFALLGIYGQSISVQPKSKIVMVHLGVSREPLTEAALERDSLWRGVLESLGGSVSP